MLSRHMFRLLDWMFKNAANLWASTISIYICFSGTFPLRQKRRKWRKLLRSLVTWSTPVWWSTNCLDDLEVVCLCNALRVIAQPQPWRTSKTVSVANYTVEWKGLITAITAVNFHWSSSPAFDRNAVEHHCVEQEANQCGMHMSCWQCSGGL